MVVLRLANFYIASIPETLRAVNVMTARDLARIQKDGGGGGSTFCLHPQNFYLKFDHMHINSIKENLFALGLLHLAKY